MGIIRSILDTDLYKLSQQKFVLQHYSNVDANYIFNNRDKSMKFNIESVNEIIKEIKNMSNLRLTDEEYDWIKRKIYFFDPMYIQYLSSYRFNPNQVKIELDSENNLKINIFGKWKDVILWEVPLMSIISEVYFNMIDIDWNHNMNIQEDLADKKATILSSAGCRFTDFGTRRRRNFDTQNLVVWIMKNYTGFMGTSNPYLAMKHNVNALGTIAHETIMAISALESMNKPNYYTMKKWLDTYGAEMGTYLTDCYTTDSFLKEFDLMFAKTFDSVRQDSGCPFEFTDKIINHYKKLRIDPTTKTIIFSDSLDVEKTIQLNEYCKGKIRCSFGIGTNLTNDYLKLNGEKSKPLNMVIKLDEVDGKKVCKLSDSPSKAIGDPSIIKIMKFIHLGEML